MDNQYINSLPIPACTVDPDGIISGANPFMKNVFVYEDIAGYNFFTMTGFKRDQLKDANQEGTDQHDRHSSAWNYCP